MEETTYSFEFHTKIRFGVGVVKKVGQLSKEFGTRNAFIVTDKGVVEAGVLETVSQVLESDGVSSVVFHEVEPNPKDNMVDRGGDHLREEKSGIIIGLGGGSSMDAAKAIRIVAEFGGDIKDYEGLGKLGKPHKLPLITIPTTAGTGAEVTGWAVITDTLRKWKMGIGSPYIAPTVALVDPSLTKTMPPRLTASTGIDALSHAIGSYLSIAAQPISDGLALHAVELISDNLRLATTNGNNVNARTGMMVGSLTAGMAMELAPCDGIHSLAETVGGHYDIPHGECIAAVLPYVMDFNLLAELGEFAKIAQAIGEKVETLNIREAAAKAVKAVNTLILDLNLPSLREIGVKEKDIPELAKRATENVCNPFNPRKVKQEDLERILTNAYEQKLFH